MVDENRNFRLLYVCCVVFCLVKLWVVIRAPRDEKERISFLCLAESYGAQYGTDLQAADALILAGDVLSRVPENVIDTAEWFSEEYRRLDTWLGSDVIRRRFPHRIVVWGDHDAPRGTKIPPTLENATVLFDAAMDVDGLKVYGSSWQPQNPSGAFYLPRGSTFLQNVWNQIPRPSDVLITHTPALGLLDSGGTTLPIGLAAEWQSLKQSVSADVFDTYSLSPLYRNSSGMQLSSGVPPSLNLSKPWGCGLLREAVKEVRPRLLVVGQSGEGYGTTRNWHGTVIVNPSLSDRSAPGRAKKPLRWELMAPDDYPKINSVEVPFVIE
ncbi:hypothetical protein DIPPA_60258 [Diplonema papillatum]|nr:hypothetical protein DIPPA_60258 [Diplonema papillatum]